MDKGAEFEIRLGPGVGLPDGWVKAFPLTWVRSGYAAKIENENSFSNLKHFIVYKFICF
jgi:hypothetical protein